MHVHFRIITNFAFRDGKIIYRFIKHIYNHNKHCHSFKKNFYSFFRQISHNLIYFFSQDGWYSEGYYDYHGTKNDESRIYSDTEYYPSTTTSSSSRRKGNIKFSALKNINFEILKRQSKYHKKNIADINN